MFLGSYWNNDLTGLRGSIGTDCADEIWNQAL